MVNLKEYAHFKLPSSCMEKIQKSREIQMKVVCVRLGRYCLYPGPNKYETGVFTLSIAPTNVLNVYHVLV